MPVNRPSPDPLAQSNGVLLDVRDLRVYFGTRRAPIRAVDDVSFALRRGESVGLVGESGCGKTTVGRSIMRLIDITQGEIRFGARNIAELEGRDLKGYRKQAQMVFQDPYGSLNARMTVGQAIEEVLAIHRLGDRRERRARAAETFRAVGLDPVYMDRYPHEFSGGQRQRIGIARALVVEPELLIADEPVSALDVSVQVQILNLMKDLQQKLNLTYLFVAHDLAVVRYLCERILVMYLGKIVESGRSAEVYAAPAHPYTAALLSVVPDVKKGLQARKTGAQRIVLKGDVPSPTRKIQGCAFHPRCPLAKAVCREQTPPLREVAPGRHSACHFAEDLLRPRS